MTRELKKIAILGASSHVARSLLPFFFNETDADLFLFGRDAEKIRSAATVDLSSSRVRVFDGFNAFENENYDLCLNCVGAGTPNALGENYSRWFTLTETFDNKILSHLSDSNPTALYVSFSSGAVYGGLRRAGAENSVLSLSVNRLNVPDYYILARLNAEAKHRSFKDLRVLDVRLFSYFSRYLDDNAGYFMSDVLRALKTKTVLHVKPSDMCRDYIAPEDLFALIVCASKADAVNETVDAYSLKPVLKSEILNAFQEKFGLNYVSDGHFVSPNAERNIYYSDYKAAGKFGYRPAKSALETLVDETKAALEGEK